MTSAAARPPTALDRADPAAVVRDPYPYVVIPDALPADVYAALCAAFPTVADLEPEVVAISNHRVDLLTSWGQTALPYERTPPVWRDFMAAHTSADYVRQVFDLFPEALTGAGDDPEIDLDLFGPDLGERLALPGPVRRDAVIARATLGVNTPVTEATAVRGPHVDSVRKAFVGLYYLRHPDDDSDGGDLAVYRWKPEAPRTHWDPKIDPDLTEQVAVIPYRPNTMVMMLNTHDSLHGVTVRQPTPHLRRLAITSGWFPGVDQAAMR